MNREEIIALKSYYEGTLYSTTRTQQQIDDDFYEDIFEVSDIVLEPVTIMRTGKARRLIDGPADHVITDNPQAFRGNLKESAKEDTANGRITKMLNTKWLQIFKNQNPNVYKQFVKFLLLRGEAWIQMAHHPDFKRGKSEDMLPVVMRIPDPMIIFASPNESAEGIPENLIVWYEVSPYLVQRNFSDFKIKEKDGVIPDNITWIEKWSDDQRYFEADGQPLVDDKNPYGIVPFVHRLSGFGTEDYQGRMEKLIVGRLKFSRDTLRRECAIISSFDYTIHTLANRSFDVQASHGAEVPSDFWENYKIGVGIGHEIPPDLTITRAADAGPDQQMFQYLGTINQQLQLEDPLALAGAPVGSSGRQQDLTKQSALRRYASIIENTETAFATAMGMGLKICDVIPKQLPSELHTDDLNKNYDVKIILRSEDPLENDRKVKMGSDLYQSGEIPLEVSHTKFQGFTKGESREMRKALIVDKLLQSEPALQMMLQTIGQESGLAQELGVSELPIQSPQSAEVKRRAQGEVKTEIGREMMDMANTQRGQRLSPEV